MLTPAAIWQLAINQSLVTEIGILLIGLSAVALGVRWVKVTFF